MTISIHEDNEDDYEVTSNYYIPSLSVQHICKSIGYNNDEATIHK